MHRTLLDDIIQTDYGQFDLIWAEGLGFDGDVDRFFEGQVNGLVGVADPEGAYLNLARRSGGSAVTITLHDDSPDGADPTWEDVVEVSVTIPDNASAKWSSWAGESSGTLTIPPGTYRLRVSARGRDAGGVGEFAEGVVDFYLLELWPARHRPDSILKIGSENAAYWHAEVGRHH
ncbi:hypothetical protein N802_09235 [Knoellia sinensis KCTC 19936]|uniref:Uncharacterized protein n=1 Tax=Knoellia sinensis KCTC 19936 TaxID=1385520 RepID=A0A0A0J3V8_9MICO|nr:hypothetical protein [Knoellia sinensis]KGN30321.1 hypothetical protein N802_09235 [Knoellia sinensis KCTC 19936]